MWGDVGRCGETALSPLMSAYSVRRFTLASVIGAAIVYDEFACMGLDDALMFSGGILAAIIGVWLLGGGRRPEASAECDTGSAAALPLAEALDAVRETTRDKLDGIRETTRDKLDKLPGSPGASWREAPSWREPRSSRDSEGDSAALAARREERRREERSSRRRRSSKGSSKAEGRGGLPPAVEQPETTLEDYEASGDFSDYEQSADDPPAPAVVNTAALARARAAKPRPSSSDLEGGGISLLPEPAINGGGPPSARGLGSSNTSLREVTDGHRQTQTDRQTHTHAHTPLTHAHRALHFECRGAPVVRRGAARDCPALAPPPRERGEVSLT